MCIILPFTFVGIVLIEPFESDTNSHLVLCDVVLRSLCLPVIMRPCSRLGSHVLRRGFASSARRLDNYAFVGLGQMVSSIHVLKTWEIQS